MKLKIRQLFLAATWRCCLIVLSFAQVRIARAQDINATVAPNIAGSNNSVDLKNTGTNNWYFWGSPTPSDASMSRIDSSGVGVYPWPSPGSFAPDPVSRSQNRIFPSEFLRVYPNHVPVNTTIQVEFSYSPSGTHYHFNVTVTSGVQVTSLNILDPSPTAAASARWRVVFDNPVSGVTAANFAFAASAGGMTGESITSVTPDTAQPSASWTITANTGIGTGLLGLNWVGSKSESPSVPNSFVGGLYDFSTYPTITQDPVGGGINRNTTLTMTAAGSVRGAPVNYQWYSGSSQNPGSATAIPGATSSSYTPPPFADIGTYQYFCQAYTTPGYYGNSVTATIIVVDPPQIVAQPVRTFYVSGQPASFTVVATGTSLQYQWYQGIPPSTANPVGMNSASLTTPATTADTSYWVRVSNPGPTIVNSATANATVVKVPAITLNPQGQSVMVGQTAVFTSLATGLYDGTAPSTLANGAALLPGQYLYSPNCGYVLVYQNDGNLVLYRAGGSTLWSSGTAGRTPGQAVMQADGNFVIYGPDNVAQYNTGTQSPNAMLALQDDGNLVIYSASHVVIFAANTGTPGPTPAPTAQWQVSTDNGATFANIGGATNSILSFTTALTDNGKQYRARFANAAGTAPTTAALLTVTKPPGPILTISKTGGTFQMTFTNAASVGFTALTTTNPALPLSNWTVLGEIPEVSPGVYHFTHGGGASSPRRFYRVSSP